MLAIVWISFVSLLQSGNGLSHHTRHERTRYVSGRNQIYGNNYYSPKFDVNQNYIPFVHYWERPLQVLESSMNVPKKLSSRPLFSWDLPLQISTYTPTKKISTTTESPTPSPVETSTRPFLKETKLLENDILSHFPATIQNPRSDRLNRAKDSVSYESVYDYKSPSKKKKKSNNRKKSIEDSSGFINSKLKEAEDGNSAKFTNEPNSRKKKKKGKTDKNKKRNKSMAEKINSETNDAVNEVSLKKTEGRNEYLEKDYATNTISKENLKMLLADETRKGVTDIPTEEAPKKSVCEMMEDKCEHQCREENGKAVCACFKGFTPVGTKCLDVNECEVNNGGCNGKCINTIGSRKCFCSPGFRLIDDSCADINECLLRNGHGPCQDQCTNTLGGYYCGCEGLPGTTLSSDKHTCEDKSKCDSGSAGCSHSCISIYGRAFCTCPDGLELGDDWKTCHDIDECSNPEDYNVECRFGCINTIGSYRCAKEISTSSSKEIST